MPIYEYDCEGCGHLFTQLRPMSAHQEPAACPTCAGMARRVMATAPRLNTLRDTLRKAHETNERSAHEPRLSHGHRCTASCSHKQQESSAGTLARQQTGKRPWMLGH